MVTEQETLIYIEDQDKLDASAAANAFAHKDTKNRAYINTLGAELALKYLASENIDVSDTYNIHSIKKILEEMDISDIMLPNIHIDVRVVFDENVIFIPKSHFEYNLVPDIYLVFNLAKDFTHVKFLGFFEPKLINKNNQNSQYYFIEKEKLSSAADLKQYIEAYSGSTKEKLSQEDLENSERIIIAMADNDISDEDKKYLIKQLTKSAELRDKFIEYENFETLSYKAMTSPEIKRKETSPEITDLSLLDELNSTNNAEVQQEMSMEEAVDLQEQTETSVTEFSELDLEPLGDIENISFDEPPVQEVQNDEHETITNDFSETFEEGAAAAAAGEVFSTLETAETALNAVDTTLDIVDNGLEISKDLISGDVTAPEAISLDDVDTSELDNIHLPEEKIEEETISLGSVDLPEETENTDFIEQIDNKISFDDIQTESLLDEPAPFNIEEETISLNDIDTSNIEEEPADQTFEAETLSFDDVDTSTLSNSIEVDENLIDNTISFDNVTIDDENEAASVEDINDNFEADTLSFDNIEEAPADEEIDDFMDDSMSFDDNDNMIETLDELPEIPESAGEDTAAEVLNDENFDNTSEETELTAEPVVEALPEPEIVEEYVDETPKNEGFGKNLLENLSEDNIDDISIEDLGIDESIGQNAEDISSNDLLSQIDDILNSSAAPETPVQEVTHEENIIQPQEEINSFDNMPDISELASVDDILSDNIPVNNETENTATAEIPEVSELTGDMPETGIDDLLNFDDGLTPSNEENDLPSEEDNIGVLFNDTDPASDTELDAIENDHFAEQDIPQQQVPGAALFNKKAQPDKKLIIVAAALVTVLAAASAFVIFKPKNDNSADIEPLAPAGTTETVKTSQTTPALPADTTDNVLATNAPDISKSAAKEVQKAQPAKELKSTPAKPKQVSSESYLSVNRLVWDVPGSLSYSSKMQNYLRTAGKSIKLSLSADLLLATEYAYTNQVKVNLKLSKDGNVQDAKIASSSGSTQIDNIVLQSVKDTLNVVKPPSNEVKTPDFNLSLIIYF